MFSVMLPALLILSTIQTSMEAEEIIMNAKDDRSLSWPNAFVPYVFGLGFYEAEKNAIRKALKDIESVTCIRFKEYGIFAFDRPTDFVYVVMGGGCRSIVGRNGGRQSLMLAPACLVDRTIKHEFLHALGLEHEHNREDRDLYIDVHYQNIQNGRNNDQFHIVHNRNTYGVPYNKQSIMHYRRVDFSNGKGPSLTSKSNYNEILSNDDLTDGDIKRLNLMYGCNGPIKGKTTTTTTMRPTTTTRRPTTTTRRPTSTTTRRPTTTTRRPTTTTRRPTTTTRRPTTTTKRPTTKSITTTTITKKSICGDFDWFCVTVQFRARERVCSQSWYKTNCPRVCKLCTGSKEEICSNFVNLNSEEDCNARRRKGQCKTSVYNVRRAMKVECTRTCCEERSLYKYQDEI